MAITIDDFNKIWASTSPLTPYEFSESNYKQGWDFVGATPPSRQMWDFLQKNNDEKLQYLLNNFDNYLPLSGGTLTGDVDITGDLSVSGAITGSILPVGIVQAFAGTTIPNGWLLCDGSAVSRTTYANLYAVIGTTYGAGNGSTTFNLPNLTDRFIQGNATAGTVKSAGLPNITGDFTTRMTASGYYAGYTAVHGAFYSDGSGGNNASVASGSDNAKRELHLDASLSSSVYGNSTTVQPPALTMQYIIKY